jgi:hypothetical protein
MILPRTIAFALPLIAADAAFAHPAHIAFAHGHSHWLGFGLLAVAGAGAVWLVLKRRRPAAGKREARLP